MVKRVVIVSALLLTLLMAPLGAGHRHQQMADVVFPPVEQTVVS